MKRTLIRYRTKSEMTQQNQHLIENVFKELQAKSPVGVRYMALKLGDGTFLHFVEMDEENNALSELEAFRSFVSNIKDRCIEPHKRTKQPSSATTGCSVKDEGPSHRLRWSNGRPY